MTGHRKVAECRSLTGAGGREGNIWRVMAAAAARAALKLTPELLRAASRRL